MHPSVWDITEKDADKPCHTEGPASISFIFHNQNKVDHLPDLIPIHPTFRTSKHANAP